VAAARAIRCPANRRDCLPCRSGVRRQVDLTLLRFDFIADLAAAHHKPLTMHQRRAVIVDLTLLAWISSRLSFVCVAVSETLQQLRCEQHGLSAPVRKRTHRVGDVPCAAASCANRS
jgi:hypothetical protein